MTSAPVDHHQLLARRDELFSPEPRLGWIFRDRRSFLRPFTEPAPQQPQLPDHLGRQVIGARQQATRRLRRTLPRSIIAAVLLMFLAACAVSDSSTAQTPVPAGMLLFALLAASPGMALTWHAVARRGKAEQHYERAQRQITGTYQAEFAQWQARRHTHEGAERIRLNAMPEWGAVPRPSRRLDVFGGTLWSWEALLTTYGTSALTQGPLVVIDLSRELVCRELAELAPHAGIGVDTQLLPSGLATSSLLAGLSAAELTDAIVESMHAEPANGSLGSAGSSRADRSMDTRILSAVCTALGDQVTLARIAAALRTLMGEPDTSDALTRDERRHIATELFTVEYRRQAHANLSRIESYIHPLEGLGVSPEPHHGYLTCLALDSRARNVGAELLTDLIVQWITHRVATTDDLVDRRPAVVVAGADELARRHLERLSDACERRDIPLTLLFRRLRETSLDMLGGGAVAFMRLGNHQDATAAADFIGRDYRFVLSQLTKNIGGNESHTHTDTTGAGDSDTTSHSHTTGTSTNWGTTRSSGVTYSPGGDAFGLFPDRSTNRGTSRTRGGGSNQSDTTGTSTTTSRNWSTAYAYATGTNWSDADTTQRVYEYIVEPTTLQHLPDHALLLMEPAAGNRSITPVECDPAIITLDRVTTGPLPEPPPPRPAIGVADAYTPGTWPPSRGEPYVPQWAAPQAPPPPRQPLPQQPGPPPGQHTGPDPDFAQEDNDDWQPGQIFPRLRPQPPPPPTPRRRTHGSTPPRQGPPPLFGRDKD